MQNMMSSYLKIKKLVEDEEDEDETSEEEEDDVAERQRAVKVRFMESQLKRKKLSLGEGGSGADKAPTGGGVAAAAPPPCCLVDSCQADLRGCKKYHQRHRVCEVHAKAPVVLVDGFRQRFCQQCSRFHEVSEFDQTKRSCRRRLAGHNERRRKSWLESQKDGTKRRHKQNQNQNQLRHLNQGLPENQGFDID